MTVNRDAALAALTQLDGTATVPKVKYSRTPEGVVKDACKAFLESIGAVIFMPVQTGLGSYALDIIACWEGNYIEVEVKAVHRGHFTKRQQWRIKLVQAAGGFSCMVRSADALRNEMIKHFGASNIQAALDRNVVRSDS